MWQDKVMMLVGIGFSIALLPTLFSKSKPQALTCLVTFLLAAVNSVCFFTLDLWLAFIGQATNGLLWLVILLQIRMGK